MFSIQVKHNCADITCMDHTRVFMIINFNTFMLLVIFCVMLKAFDNVSYKCYCNYCEQQIDTVSYLLLKINTKQCTHQFYIYCEAACEGTIN